MKKERKKGEKKLALSFFFAREKNGDCSRKFRRRQNSGHDSSVCRPNGFAAQDQSSKCRFPRSALQTSPYDDRKKTKTSTTCTYYREILTVRAQRSSFFFYIKKQQKVCSRSPFFALRFCVFVAPGLEWSRISSFSQPWPWQKEACADIFDTDLTNTSFLATFFYIQTCTHLWTLSRTFLGVCTHPYTGARVSSTYARTHVPTPRRFLSKPSAAFYVYLSSCCYFSVFSSVCIWKLQQKVCSVIDGAWERVCVHICWIHVRRCTGACICPKCVW